ncbi:unnamed protein product, partial [Urochloa humidicola]
FWVTVNTCEGKFSDLQSTGGASDLCAAEAGGGVRWRPARRCAAVAGSGARAAAAGPACSCSRARAAACGSSCTRATAAARVQWPRSRRAAAAGEVSAQRRPRSQHATTSGGALYLNATSSNTPTTLECNQNTGSRIQEGVAAEKTGRNTFLNEQEEKQKLIPACPCGCAFVISGVHIVPCSSVVKLLFHYLNLWFAC